MRSALVCIIYVCAEFGLNLECFLKGLYFYVMLTRVVCAPVKCCVKNTKDYLF